MVFHSGASWEKSPCIVFRICNYGNNSKKCAGHRGLGSDLTYWPTDPLYTISPQYLRETMAVMISFRSLISHFCYNFLFLLLSCFLRFGRHPVLILSVLFMLVFGLSVAFSVNVTMFSTLRFFEGFCLAGLALSLYVLSKYLLSLPPSAFSFQLSKSSVVSLSSSSLCV